MNKHITLVKILLIFFLWAAPSCSYLCLERQNICLELLGVPIKFWKHEGRPKLTKQMKKRMIDTCICLAFRNFGGHLGLPNVIAVHHIEKCKMFRFCSILVRVIKIVAFWEFAVISSAPHVIMCILSLSFLSRISQLDLFWKFIGHW